MHPAHQNKNHFLKICDLIIERGYDFNIWAYARVDTVREEYLEKLKKAGVNWLALGIESGNRKIRVDSVKGKFREVDVKDIVDKIDMARCTSQYPVDKMERVAIRSSL